MAHQERDLSRLCAWLSENTQLGSNCRIVTVGQPKTGFSAYTLLCSIISDTGEADVVVRIEHGGRTIFKDASIERQARMMEALRDRGIVVPEILGWDEDEAILGAPFLVMRRADGVSLPQHPSYHVAGLLIDLDLAGCARAWQQSLEIIAKINLLDWRAGFDFLLSPSYGEPGLDHYLGWMGAWRVMAHAAPHPVIDRAMQFLHDNRPPLAEAGVRAGVLWGDSNPGNLLFGRDGSVTAALDFEAASIGPAEIDLGWWFLVDRMLSAGNPLPTGMPDREEQIAIFERALGRPVIDLPYFEILAALRMAFVIARTGGFLIDEGTLPADNQVAVYNPGVTLLADLLGMEHDARMDHYMAMVHAMNQR